MNHVTSSDSICHVFRLLGADYLRETSCRLPDRFRRRHATKQFDELRITYRQSTFDFQRSGAGASPPSLRYAPRANSAAESAQLLQRVDLAADTEQVASHRTSVTVFEMKI